MLDVIVGRALDEGMLAVARKCEQQAGSSSNFLLSRGSARSAGSSRSSEVRLGDC